MLKYIDVRIGTTEGIRLFYLTCPSFECANMLIWFLPRIPNYAKMLPVIVISLSSLTGHVMTRKKVETKTLNGPVLQTSLVCQLRQNFNCIAPRFELDFIQTLNMSLKLLFHVSKFKYKSFRLNQMKFLDHPMNFDAKPCRLVVWWKDGIQNFSMVLTSHPSELTVKIDKNDIF